MIIREAMMVVEIQSLGLVILMMLELVMGLILVVKRVLVVWLFVAVINFSMGLCVAI